ncbi:MAG: hypothetical protein L0H53_07440 [Candidatus Nitrosocosmicus sp.]|nr:hypothetical protein [Candidatus Nitrosocosmicus sp.]MDN5866955.1 hypothetical protein [Candidatus Nitrosocosmicus sp.]
MVKNLYCKSKGTANLQNKTQAERYEESMITTSTKRIILIDQRNYIVGMFDLGFLGLQKDYPEQKSSFAY